jgi:hypothetical protein
MLAEAYIRHSIAGRLRIKIPSQRGNLSFFTNIQDQLAGCQGIERIEANPMTGSLLLYHLLEIQSIANYAKVHGLFEIRSMTRSSTSFSKTLTETYKQFNKKITAATEGYANIPDLAFIALIGLGIYQIVQGNFAAPAWYAAFWYALNIFLKAQSPKTVNME